MYLNLNRFAKTILFYSTIYFYNLFLMFHVNHFTVFHFIWLCFHELFFASDDGTLFPFFPSSLYFLLCRFVLRLYRAFICHTRAAKPHTHVSTRWWYGVYGKAGFTLQKDRNLWETERPIDRPTVTAPLILHRFEFEIKARKPRNEYPTAHSHRIKESPENFAVRRSRTRLIYPPFSVIVCMQRWLV